MWLNGMDWGTSKVSCGDVKYVNYIELLSIFLLR